MNKDRLDTNAVHLIFGGRCMWCIVFIINIILFYIF